jgi:hypothetical protein
VQFGVLVHFLQEDFGLASAKSAYRALSQVILLWDGEGTARSGTACHAAPMGVSY